MLWCLSVLWPYIIKWISLSTVDLDKWICDKTESTSYKVILIYTTRPTKFMCSNTNLTRTWIAVHICVLMLVKLELIDICCIHDSRDNETNVFKTVKPIFKFWPIRHKNIKGLTWDSIVKAYCLFTYWNALIAYKRT